MGNSVRIIDPSVKDELLRFPTVELIRLLFPDVKMHGRSVLCNPLRGERHPSLSCFRSYDGYPKWKDHATGEVGDNIDFFRLAHPDLGYVEAVDALSRLVLGKTALGESVVGDIPSYVHKAAVTHHVPLCETPGALVLRGVAPYEWSPRELVDYTRSRGISDEVASKYLRSVTYINTNASGRTLIDPHSGLPLYDSDGNPQRRDGVCISLGMPNDILGYSLRTPDTPLSKGFKGATSSFLTTISASGEYGCDDPRVVRIYGSDAPQLKYFSYDVSSMSLYVSEGVYFCPVRPEVLHIAIPFLDDWSGRYLEGRELRCTLAVLRALNRASGRKVFVVEGMFDALSHIELEVMAGHCAVPGDDLIVLSSLSNLRWALPLMSAYTEVCSVLDNDLRSGAGQNAFVKMQESIGAFSFRTGKPVSVVSLSGGLAPYKDLNEYLMYRKGFRVEPSFEGVEQGKAAARRGSRKNEVKQLKSI